MNEYGLAIFLLILGFAGRNESLIYSMIIILTLKCLKQDYLMYLLSDKGLNIGVTILTAAILVKLFDGSVDISIFFESFKTKLGIITILSGILTAAAAGRGIIALQNNPEMISSLVIGTIAGIFFFKGVAVGPLIAAGFAYFIMIIIK
ncbi:MAG: DUF441 domain-containing protein [Selenomonadaceae bacterium]|nr:DUF441 domain-containing protein [Selenomonadaceae bacterium]